MDVQKVDIQEILDGYRKRYFKPSELVLDYLSAIERENPSLNAFLEIQPEQVLERAKLLDGRVHEFSRLPLYGIPVAVKDIILVRGLKATAGSKILADYAAPYTAPSVEKLENAGAIVIGKTNLDEFAMGSSNENSAFGPAKNPWDRTRVSGGSSGGSAVAVAAGLAPAAIGTDTGGSIRQPASFCGVVGLKPSYGRVSRYGVIAFASSLDQVGPITRTVWDSARVLEIMAGYSGKDATASRKVVPSYTEALKSYSIKNLRIGIAREWLGEVASDVEKSFNESIKLFQSEGARLVDISLPHVKYAISTYYLIAPSEASSNLARYDGIRYGRRAKKVGSGEELFFKTRGEGFGKEVKLRIMLGTYALSAGYYDAFYLKANRVRGLIQKDFQDAFKKCDCIMAPTAPTTAFKLGEKIEDPIKMYLSDVFTIPANLAGLPGISLPCGLDSDNLPIGLQLYGKPFDEMLLFQLGHCFERARGGFPCPSDIKVKEKA